MHMEAVCAVGGVDIGSNVSNALPKRCFLAFGKVWRKQGRKVMWLPAQAHRSTVGWSWKYSTLRSLRLCQDMSCNLYFIPSMDYAICQRANQGFRKPEDGNEIQERDHFLVFYRTW